jgi:hypothetical protein
MRPLLANSQRRRVFQSALLGCVACVIVSRAFCAARTRSVLSENEAMRGHNKFYCFLANEATNSSFLANDPNRVRFPKPVCIKMIPESAGAER